MTCDPKALAGIDVTTDDNGESGGDGYGDDGRDHSDDTRSRAKRSEFIRLSADDWDRLDRVYRATNSRGLTMDRTEEWWRKRVFTGWDDDPYVAGWVRNGRLAGYLVYDIEEDDHDDDRRMVVSEYGHVDFEAYRAILMFCRYHDSQVNEIEFTGPVETALQDLVRDPSEIKIEIEPGPTIRIVDVEHALSMLSYPSDVEADLILNVADDLASWNDGQFHLSIAGGTGTCEPTDADGRGAVDADLETSIATLSQVAVGYLSIERAKQVGGFDVASEGVRETLATVFPPEKTFLRESF